MIFVSRHLHTNHSPNDYLMACQPQGKLTARVSSDSQSGVSPSSAAVSLSLSASSSTNRTTLTTTQQQIDMHTTNCIAGLRQHKQHDQKMIIARKLFIRSKTSQYKDTARCVLPFLNMAAQLLSKTSLVPYVHTCTHIYIHTPLGDGLAKWFRLNHIRQCCCELKSFGVCSKKENEQET